MRYCSIDEQEKATRVLLSKLGETSIGLQQTSQSSI